jgi:hypothetical protein
MSNPTDYTLFVYDYKLVFVTTVKELAAGMKMPPSEVGSLIGDPKPDADAPLFMLHVVEVSPTYRDEADTVAHVLAKIVPDIISKMPEQTPELGLWKPRIGDVTGECYGVPAAELAMVTGQFETDQPVVMGAVPLTRSIALGMLTSAKRNPDPINN